MAVLLAGLLLFGQVVVPPEVEDVAAEANVNPVDLLGAMTSTGLEARAYLHMSGELAPPRPVARAAPSSSPRVECIIRHESGGDPRAVNRRSGASGLGQFLPSTWRTTPQGKAGLSVFDPAANRAAVAWMLAVGRGREFAVIGRC